MSPGHESNLTHLLFSNTSAQDYEKLCSLDVLGIEENHNFKDTEILDKFKKQLKQSDEGWYETGLIWKTDHPVLTNNKSNSLGRLNNLLKHLKKNSEKFIAYDKVIQEQLEDGIVEKVSDITPQKGKEFYLPHKAIIREDAERTKLRIVNDASSKPNMNEPSLNECLEKGPPLQNMLRDALVRNRMKPVALCADLRKAFLQIRIRKCRKNILRFHWIKNQNVSDTEILRFTRLVFGLIQSPFILEAILQSHLSKYEKTYPKEIEEIKNSMYVDDMISGGNNEAEVVYLKNSAKTIFKGGGFVLHKWHSNNPRLEEGDFDRNNSELSYAKQQLGSKSSETKVLGIHWNKVRDMLGIRFSLEKM